MNEAGHAKNIANYASYISMVTIFGTVYKPSNPLIALTALQSSLTDFEAAKDAVTPKASAETVALNERQEVFERLSELITRVVNAAAVSVNDQLFSNDLRTIARKAQGKRTAKKVADDPATPDVDESKQSISASQMSFDSRIANFEELINLLTTSGAYKPNEDDLKISALETFLADLKAKNAAAVNAQNEARAARIARDQTLYNDTDGIIALANLVKKYVKSLFGATSPQYKQLTALKFKKP
jgi:3-dehydroquinate synthase class II